MNKPLHLKKVTLMFLLLAGTLNIYSQHVVTGKVTDSQGPLIGAAVTIKDASIPTGTVTDVNGNYSIKVPNSKTILIYSYIGYTNKAEVIGKRTTVNITLEEDSKMLDDVVVIGYGTQAKSHLTGSISKLDGQSLINSPVSDVTTALQGSMSGLTIANETSEVGVTPSIRIRGASSISAESEPLVIIDGFPVEGGLSSINASDVKSIEVLKDAASAAIYGSRAANGVIMVTTKSGTPDKPKYSFKFYQGFKYAYQLHDMMTSSEWLNLLNEEAEIGGPTVPAAARAAAYLESQMGSTNWQKEGLRDLAGITNAQMSISGGRKETKYFISAAYTKDQGVMLQNSLDKLNFRTKLDTKLSRITSIGVNLSGTYKKTERPKNNFIDFYRTPSFLPVYHNDLSTALTGYTGFARGSHFNNIITPTGTPDAEGNPTSETSSPFSSANNNPRSVMANTTRWSESMQGLASIYLTIDLCKGLQFKTSNGLNVSFSPSYYYGNKNATKDKEESRATYFSSLYVDLLSENTLNYHLNFGKNKFHSIEALLGYTIESTRNQRVAMTATGFATDDIHTLNAATVYSLASENNGNTDGTGTFRYPDVVLESYLGRINYNYRGRYLLSTSLRLDRSSLFSKGNRNAWFPSVSVGWRASEEKFMKSIDAISNLKLRASYGATGNNRISYDAALEVLNSANYVTGLGTGQLVSGSANTSSTLANSNITWEKTDEFNYGLDLGLFKNRINLSIDAYYSVTRALLFAQPTQSFTGYSYYWNNIGKVRNSGLEIQIDTHNIKNRKFSWNTNFNFSLSRNKLLELGGEQQVISQGERSECYIAKVSSPLIQFYGYKTNGVWNSTEEINANPHFANDVPGGLRIVDTDGNGSLTSDDRVPLGNPYPDFTWGITNTFQIKNFDISFLIQGVQGITVYNGDVYYNETVKWNKKYTKGRWVSAENPGNGKTPYLKLGYDIALTDYPLQNASYACLRNFTLGYTLPNTVAHKMRLSGVRFYVSGSNLLYIWGSDYKGINPESRMTSSKYSSSMISGYQRGGFPLTTTISAGFDINF
ncbi:MAG: TonB-dependent receptor [Bacteroides sp.]|jgi:TonB-linked SusC/RagA family outer membrane protein|nr:TonB-dependent receptor [Bacteroides sp.]MCI1681671.1 TonB-dependent receptor [Bacteroides sp.]